jgi:thiol-disulfide isomerase/thioredoxin
VLTLAGCANPGADRLAEGEWRAWLDSPGGDLPFGMEISRNGAELEVVIVNGSERIRVPRVETNGAELVLGIDHYDSTIVASITGRGRRLSGHWEKTVGPEESAALPFHATAGREERFGSDPSAASSENSSIDGRWTVDFSDSDGPAVGIFSSDPDGVVEGTFLTTTGDYRYLAGRFDGRRLRLSCFDGAHAFLFDARIQAAGTLAGDFWSRGNWHEQWTAHRDPEADLGDAFAQVHAVAGVDLDDISYPDLDGRPRFLNDPEFAGRARILYVFGSWCPNCGDATRLMVELDRRFRRRGLSIVGLAFEMTGDLGRDTEQVRRYAEHHDVEYPVLIAGRSDKMEASTAFPVVDRVRAYPTTVFLDQAGAVRAVHSGFSGPATGEAHEELRQRFETLIEDLLGDEQAES